MSGRAAADRPGSRMVLKSVEDPVGFPAAGRPCDQPNVPHGSQSVGQPPPMAGNENHSYFGSVGLACPRLIPENTLKLLLRGCWQRSVFRNASRVGLYAFDQARCNQREFWAAALGFAEWGGGCLDLSSEGSVPVIATQIFRMN